MPIFILKKQDKKKQLGEYRLRTTHEVGVFRLATNLVSRHISKKHVLRTHRGQGKITQELTRKFFEIQAA